MYFGLLKSKHVKNTLRYFIPLLLLWILVMFFALLQLTFKPYIMFVEDFQLVFSTRSSVLRAFRRPKWIALVHPNTSQDARESKQWISVFSFESGLKRTDVTLLPWNNKQFTAHTTLVFYTHAGPNQLNAILNMTWHLLSLLRRVR